GCSSVVEHLLAKEDVASSSLVTRSSLRLSSAKAKSGARAPGARRRRAWFLTFIFRSKDYGLAGRSCVFLESKLLPGCISLPKDEYENIASLHLLSCAGCCGHRAACAPVSSAGPSG